MLANQANRCPSDLRQCTGNGIDDRQQQGADNGRASLKRIHDKLGIV